jgi:acetylornithine deacetylase
MSAMSPVSLSFSPASISAQVNETELVSIAQDLIKIRSPTEGEAPVTAYVAQLLGAAGFDIVIQDVSPGRPQVVGRLKGKGNGRSLMFNGHSDNDSITEDWQWDPFEPKIDGNKLWGAGIHNMKSGVAAMLAAALAVKRSNVTLRGDLIVACVVGELQGGKGTIHLVNTGIRSDMAIVPEPYSTNTIITKCVGVHKCAISTIGKSIHTSRSQFGVDAIQQMLKVISALSNIGLPCSDPDFPGLPKVLVSSIIGGRGRDYDLAGPSNLSDFCTIIVDLRYSGEWTPDSIDDKFISLLNSLRSADPLFRYEYHHPPPSRFKVGGADMPPTNVSPKSEVVDIVKRVHELVTGRQIEHVGVVLPYSYCGNDTAHLERAGIPCCLYGPRGYPEEVEKHVRIDEMIECSRTLVGAAVEVCT